MAKNDKSKKKYVYVVMKAGGALIGAYKTRRGAAETCECLNRVSSIAYDVQELELHD